MSHHDPDPATGFWRSPPGLRQLLVLLPSAALGGAEAQTLAITDAVAATGARVTLAIDQGLAPRLTARVGPGTEVVAAALVPGPEQFAAASALIATHRPDLVLLPLPWPTHGAGIEAAIAAAGRPGVSITHLAPPDPPMMAEVTAPWLRRVAVSAPIARRVEAMFGLDEGAVAVIPNGVAPARCDPGARAAKRALLGLGAAAPLVLAVGRLEPNKGADLLPAIAARSGATLVALGEGPLRSQLAGTGVRLLGEVDDVGAWMDAADALVLASRLEGCPLVFLEAAARRLPVVATAAALEAFGAEAGLLAALVEAPAAGPLADRLVGVLAPGAATGMRVAAAAAHAAAWDRGAMVARYLAVLRGALG